MTNEMKKFHTKTYICEAMRFTGDTEALVKAGIAFQSEVKPSDPTDISYKYWDQNLQVWCALPVGMWMVKEPDTSLYLQTDEHFTMRWVEDGPIMRGKTTR